MLIGFLIITFGDNYLDNCISSIRKFYDYPIYIIDNKINGDIDTIFLKKYTSVYYAKNKNNTFELGAIWEACKIFNHIDKFIILHNSMMLIEKLPIDIENQSFMSFWKTIVCDYSPVVPWVINKLKEFNIDIEYDKPWFSIAGCCCIIDTCHLKKLIDYGYDKIYGVLKTQAVSTEILFGYLISNVLNIDNNSLFECTLDDNVSGRVNFKYIKKIAGGQGYPGPIQELNLSNFPLFDKIFKIDINKHTDLNLCYIDIINEIDKDENKDIQEFLINSEPKVLIYPNEKFSVILSIRHRLFTKLFFPTYYNYEKQLILTHKKKLF